jgi:hypothetical protein
MPSLPGYLPETVDSAPRGQALPRSLTQYDAGAEDGLLPRWKQTGPPSRPNQLCALAVSKTPALEGKAAKSSILSNFGSRPITAQTLRNQALDFDH